MDVNSSKYGVLICPDCGEDYMIDASCKCTREFREKLKNRILEKAKFDVDIPAFEQGQRDAQRNIYGFNPFCPGTNRARSYDLGND